MNVARPPIINRVRERPRRMRHRTTEVTVHKIGPGGMRTADECARFFLASPEGVATVSLGGDWAAKLPVFYAWARLSSCPVCLAVTGAYCTTPRSARSPVPHPARPGMVPAAHLEKADVPYHLMVEPEGLIYQYLPLMARGAHAVRSNGRAIAVACVGDYDKERPPAAMMNSLRWLLKWLALDMGTKIATEQDQGLLVVRGHDEVRDHPKGCPGRFLLPEIAPINHWLTGIKNQEEG